METTPSSTPSDGVNNHFKIHNSGRYYAGDDHSHQTTNHGTVHYNDDYTETRNSEANADYGSDDETLNGIDIRSQPPSNAPRYTHSQTTPAEPAEPHHNRGDRPQARDPSRTPGSEPQGISEEEMRALPPSVLAYMERLERQIASQADTHPTHGGHAENSIPLTDQT